MNLQAGRDYLNKALTLANALHSVVEATGKIEPRELKEIINNIKWANYRITADRYRPRHSDKRDLYETIANNLSLYIGCTYAGSDVEPPEYGEYDTDDVLDEIANICGENQMLCDYIQDTFDFDDFDDWLIQQGDRFISE